jgi:aspartate/glutamate racemase
VLATEGTGASGLYRDALARHGTAQFPTTAVQPTVTEIIFARKAGVPVIELAPRLDRIIGELRGQGAGRVLLACTELSELSGALHGDPADAMDLVITHLMRRVAQWQHHGAFADDGLLLA